MPVPRLQIEDTALLVVDLQEKLLPHMHNAEALTARSATLIAGAAALGVRTLVTEQYRKGLGNTVDTIADRLPEGCERHEKLIFSSCIDPVRKHLSQHNIRSVIVCGIETHVCVLQTCLDLLDAGYLAFVATDATGSRREADQACAIERMVQAGVVPTTVESALLELVHEAGTDRFKAVLPLIK